MVLNLIAIKKLRLSPRCEAPQRLQLSKLFKHCKETVVVCVSYCYNCMYNGFSCISGFLQQTVDSFGCRVLSKFVEDVSSLLACNYNCVNSDICNVSIDVLQFLVHEGGLLQHPYQWTPKCSINYLYSFHQSLGVTQ